MSLFRRRDPPPIEPTSTLSEAEKAWRDAQLREYAERARGLDRLARIQTRDED